MLFSFVCLTFIVCGGDRQVGAGQLCSWFRVRFARLNNLTSKEDATYEPINMIRRRTFLGASRPLFLATAVVFCVGRCRASEGVKVNLGLLAYTHSVRIL